MFSCRKTATQIILLAGPVSTLSCFTLQDRTFCAVWHQSNCDLWFLFSLLQNFSCFSDRHVKTQGNIVFMLKRVKNFKDPYSGRSKHYAFKLTSGMKIKKSKILNVILTRSLYCINYENENYFEQIKPHFSWEPPLNL